LNPVRDFANLRLLQCGDGPYLVVDHKICSLGTIDIDGIEGEFRVISRTAVVECFQPLSDSAAVCFEF